MGHPVASHSYFRIKNQAEERALFLADPHYIPTFQYAKTYDLNTVERTIEAYGDMPPLSLMLVHSSLLLERHRDERSCHAFRQLNRKLYGNPESNIVDSILCEIGERVNAGDRRLWDETIALLPRSPRAVGSVRPSDQLFYACKRFFARYRRGTPRHPGEPIAARIDLLLQDTGLSKIGWSVRVLAGDSPVRVNHAKKQVQLGSLYSPRTTKATAKIIVHEVYGHIIRDGSFSLRESEGFAILLEQLLDSTFRFRRSYRYMAAALAWGVYGQALAFRDVHEILWRIMVINSHYSHEKAQILAFDECARVFRGGQPGMKGAVYLKDTAYLKGNLEVWRHLPISLTYQEFVDILEGRRKVLL